MPRVTTWKVGDWVKPATPAGAVRWTAARLQIAEITESRLGGWDVIRFEGPEETFSYPNWCSDQFVLVSFATPLTKPKFKVGDKLRDAPGRTFFKGYPTTPRTVLSVQHNGLAWACYFAVDGSIWATEDFFQLDLTAPAAAHDFKVGDLVTAVDFESYNACEIQRNHPLCGKAASIERLEMYNGSLSAMWGNQFHWPLAGLRLVSQQQKKCECGAAHLGASKNSPLHSSWCPEKNDAHHSRRL